MRKPVKKLLGGGILASLLGAMGWTFWVHVGKARARREAAA
jgi:hypothetical protein